jgi:hypothetical protein
MYTTVMYIYIQRFERYNKRNELTRHSSFIVNQTIQLQMN